MRMAVDIYLMSTFSNLSLAAGVGVMVVGVVSVRISYIILSCVENNWTISVLSTHLWEYMDYGQIFPALQDPAKDLVLKHGDLGMHNVLILCPLVSL